jgi:glycosyltransferase involved in cell wall biosynthesis
MSEISGENSTVELPQAFFESERINIILQIQGMVTAGFTKGEGDFSGINNPNYGKDLSKYDDTGGQTANSFEKLHFYAKDEIPTIMFAMSTNPESASPVIAKHNMADDEHGYVVYLPWTNGDGLNILQEIGINPNNDGLVPKETMMKHKDAIFPFIAEQAKDFLYNNIENIQNKDLMIDANYADGMQTGLHLKQNLIQNEHQGEVIAIGTFHTHGIAKFIDVSAKELGSANSDFVKLLKNKSVKIEGYNNQDIEEIKASVSALPTDERNKIEAAARKYSFFERLAIESVDNLIANDANGKVGFDGLMAIDPIMQERLNRTFEPHGVKVGFATNAYNENIYNLEVFKDKPQAEINNDIYELLQTRAYPTSTQLPPELSLEQIASNNIFITACRPDSRKNSSGFIDAFVEMKRQNPDDNSIMVLAGHAPEKAKSGNYEIANEDQQAIINKINQVIAENPDLNLQNNILLLPSLTADKISLLLSAERAVGVCASSQEPWGIGGVEMFAKGVPVIASNLYASADTVKKNIAANEREAKDSIILFTSPVEVERSESIKSLVNAMQEVSENYAAYASRAENLAPDIAKNYKWSGMVRTYEQMADDIFSNVAQYKLNDNISPTSTIASDGVQTNPIFSEKALSFNR